MMSLWTLFVIEIFGSFWAATFGLAIIMYIILVLGGTSQDTCLTYSFIFILFMCIGYGQILISIMMTIVTVFMNILILPRMINRASQ